MARVWTLSQDRQFYLSNGAAPRPVAEIPPVVTEPHVNLSRFRGRSIYSSTPPPVGYTSPVYLPDSTWPTLPDQPTIRFVDYYQAGDTFRQTCSRMQAYCQAQGSATSSDGYRQFELPDGEFTFADFPMATTNKFGLFFDRNLGYIGQGPDNTMIRLERMSSTVGTGGTMMRLAGNSSGALPGGLVPINYGYTLAGSEQPDQTYTQTSTPGTPEVGPQLYSGHVHYQTVGEIMQKVRHLGTSCGNWNSPPGETFSNNSYKCLNLTLRGVEVSGFDYDGKRWGGSPFGGNNSVGDLIEDAWLHHSYVSGLTWSFSGDDDSLPSISRDFTTRRVRIEHNANIAPRRSGKYFAIINNENAGGTILHDELQAFVDNSVAPSQWLWNANHSSIVGKLFDNTDITYKFNTVNDWTQVHPRWQGCVVLVRSSVYGSPAMPQLQQTAPKVYVGGNLLTAINWTSGNTGTPPTVSPSTHYFWVVS